ncbi:hypothetical protein J7T55_003715 [Diaporthe amygdali]|uniref:uncharacterized protein n=1 Tax=Phomopsis amygdali TaxID=1214568 RepID=UPI0022FE0A94|nr:uncharacterized protein J7T55_003715 [Diaporthe amygdali]KAJ0117303.1 hypothetical protein J7T55_003715 [Diaporthe amygdali]
MKLYGHILVALTAAIPAHGQTPSSTSSSKPTTTVSGLTATLTSSASTSSSTSQEGCPTVTLTSNICHSCATPDCVELEPLTQSCDCPSAIPTVFVDYPCESGCGGIGCAANYVFFTANCTSDSSSSSSTSSGAASGNSTASATGTGLGGLNSTASGVTSSGTSTRSGSSSETGTAAQSSSSIAAAGRMRPFWMELL